jgi:6-phosphogluconolactonase
METQPKVLLVDDADALADAAAGAIVDAAQEAVATSHRFSIVLSGGGTPRATYMRLAASPFAERMPWDRTWVFFGDERCVPPDHPSSNYRMANEALLSKVAIPADHVHRMRGEEDPEAAATEYARTLATFFESKRGGLPRFDLVLLGVGLDGHTASLFPGSSALGEEKRWVAATWVEKLKRTRITVTLPVLNRAALVIFLVAGDEKAEAARRAIEGAAPGLEVPARRVDPPGGRVLWLLDRLAASKLTAKA